MLIINHTPTMAAAPPTQPPPPTAPARPTAAAAACRHCGAPDISLEWHERFKVLVCESCARRHERLINKTSAKATYLLSDSDLYGLGFVEKQNPRHQKFAVMKQFLVSQVEDVAVAKHGSLEALEEEKQRRMQGKLEQRLQKRQAAEEQEAREQRRAAHLQATLAKYGVGVQEEDEDDAGEDDPGGGAGSRGGSGGGSGSKRKKQQAAEPARLQDVCADVEEF